MAKITGSVQEKVFSLSGWGGLNENPDGDTKLKLGEASVMVNWRVTRDGNLKRRPGSDLVCGCRPGYTVRVWDSHDTEPTKVLTSASISVRQDIMAEEAGAGRPGFLRLCGESASADGENYADYIGWCFEHKGKYWKLESATADEDGTTWYGYRVTAVPTAQNTKPIAGMWTGWIDNEEIMLVACDGFVYRINPDGGASTRSAVGALDTSNGVHMFGFQGKVYFLNGQEYYEWDGSTFKVVEGYRPLVVIGLTPDGLNEQLEHVNLLNGTRRVWLSPDGNPDSDESQGRTFQLPEKEISSIDYVLDLKTGEELPATAYVYNLSAGTVTFSVAPQQGVNSYEVGYSMSTTYRHQVTRMRFSELYSGTQDTRIFIYGDGSNQCLYSGLDYYGKPRGDYFADLDACAIGDENTPITSMIRHYSTLVCFKRGSAWSLTYGVLSLTSDTMAPAFYGTPVNRRMGNEPAGQVVLVNNSPVTLSNGEVYQWQNSSYYSSNLTQDERQAKRISDRIQKSIREFDLAGCFCYDDNYGQEYYICCDGDALVWNYAADAWYKYEGLDMVAACNLDGELYYGTSDGRVFRLTDEVSTCDAEPIEALWESGAMSFGQDYMRKHAAMLWVGIKPDDNIANADAATVTVTVRTDRKAEFAEKIVTTAKARVDGEPFMTRLKIKAKKFTFYTLIFKSDGQGDTPTINCADIRVRFQGYAK